MYVSRSIKLALGILLCLLVLSLSAGSVFAAAWVEPAISAGRDHTLALKSDGTVWAWGWNAQGQLGDNTFTSRTSPVQVKGPGGVGYLTDVVAVSAGRTHSLALKNDGTVWTWGSNNSGQLGNRTDDWSQTPVQVKIFSTGDLNLVGVVEIDAGYNHSVALAENGYVWTWGFNSVGQLGDGTNINRNYANLVKNEDGSGLLDNIKAISAGSSHTLALDETDGYVYAWGWNHFGQLGDVSTVSRNLPVLAKLFYPGPDIYLAFSGIQSISAGHGHSLALKNDGTVLAWGRNEDGELGIGSSEDQITAATVEVKGVGGTGTLSGITAISAGYYHSMALTDTGRVNAWGNNDYGQLGDDSLTTSNVPVTVIVSYFTMPLPPYTSSSDSKTLT